MFCELIECLDAKTLRGAVQEFLDQSLLACQARDVDTMIRLATSARWVSVECSDAIGESAALLHLGVAFLASHRIEDARRVFGWASRTLHREPEWRQRFNEGIALFGLGLALQLSDPPSQLPSIARFQQALELLESVREYYWSAANDQKVLEIDLLARELRARISAQVPSEYVDADESEGIDAPANDTEQDDASTVFTQDKDASWTEGFRRDTPGDIWPTDLDL